MWFELTHSEWSEFRSFSTLSLLSFTCAVLLFGFFLSSSDRFPGKSQESQEKAEIITVSAFAFSGVMRLSIMHWRSQEPCMYGHHSCLAFAIELADLSWDVTASALGASCWCLLKKSWGHRESCRDYRNETLHLSRWFRSENISMKLLF